MIFPILFILIILVPAYFIVSSRKLSGPKKIVISILYLILCFIGISQFIINGWERGRYQANKRMIQDVTVKDTIQNKTSKDSIGQAVYGKLIPLEIIDPDNKNVYEKYGMEMGGNCYSCDLAEIKIDKRFFEIMNVCDKNDVYRIENFKYEINDPEIKIFSSKYSFIFTKVDNGPVYELKISGEKFSSKNKRMSKFYTFEKNLNKFKLHDCGDFQG